MFVIETNENNPAALKLLIAANVNQKAVEIKLIKNVRNSAEPLPVLKVQNSYSIFMPNTALWSIFPVHEDVEDLVNQFLETEATVLVSQLCGMSGDCRKKNEIQSKYLETLNKHLEDKIYLVGSELTAADVAIWSSLYPLTIDDKTFQDFFGGLENLIKWINFHKSQDAFKVSTEQFKISSAQAAYKALMEGAKYPVSAEQEIENKSQGSSPNQSPQHQADIVTEEEIKEAEKAWSDTSVQTKLIKPEKPVLPIPSQRNILITSALPYVNNVPHLGNIIGCVLSADVFARFCRLCNYNTLFVCGTDEYGTATETKALQEGLTCQAICDKYFKMHSEIYQWFNISFDHFGRTTTPQQTQLCQSMFLQLNQNGFIFTQSVDQLHCEKCDRYLADRFVEGGCPNAGCTYEDARGDQCDGCGKLVNAVELKNPRCKICKDTPKLKSSTQFFLDLPKLEPLLLHWMKGSSPGWSHNAQVIGKAWMREGLKPRCITRDLKWGVQVPMEGFMDKVFYVWFDAPLGYMSITKNYTEAWEKWWRPDEEVEVGLYQFMAKDNVPFHAVMFPATVLGANRGYITVSHIMATEYLNYEDGKFSKSRGVGVFGNDAQDTGIESDVFRFYLLYVRPESQDSCFCWDDLATKNNSELLNNLGNFVNRGLKFAKTFFNQIVPDMQLTKDDYTFLALCTRELKNYILSVEKAKLRDGIRHILAISRHGNQYLQVNQPWVLLKGSDADKTRAGTIIGLCCNVICVLATLLQPYMPDTSANLKKQLNCTEIVLTPSNPKITCLLPPGHKLGEPALLFTKIEQARIDDLRKKFAGKQNGEESGANGVVYSINDIKKLEEDIAKQGEKVRALKSKGLTKVLIKPDIDLLLELKSKHEVLTKSQGNSKPANTPKPSKQQSKKHKKIDALNACGASGATSGSQVNSLTEEIDDYSHFYKNLPSEIEALQKELKIEEDAYKKIKAKHPVSNEESKEQAKKIVGLKTKLILSETCQAVNNSITIKENNKK